MERKAIIITGASDGIGAAAAKRLSADGHNVVIVGRSPSKTEAVARELGTDFYLADFARLSDVCWLADELLEKYPRIDVLANNAGAIFGSERQVTPNGHEFTFQVNYLASFLLTTRLLDRLRKSLATVIFTSSIGNSVFGNMDINDLENEKNYRPTKAYGNSKLAQILFARELHRRYGYRGLAAVAFHPGNIASNFSSEPGSVFQLLYHTPFRNLWTASPEKGADTLIFLAEGEPGVDFPSGEYFVKRKVAKPNKQANDPDLARELWNRSEVMIRGF
ncbi:MAG: SDR family NAD(P)-dependent oxidoreductase, partial [Deltaproteobacteria bacterium]